MISTTPCTASLPAETAGYYADFHGLEDIAAALREGYVYQGQYSEYRHRRHGRPPRGVAPEQLVVCAQNHDQIGNRAQGERLSMLIGVPQLKAVAALTLLSPFVPLAVPGRGMGRDARPSCTSPITRTPPWAAWSPRVEPKSSASFRWAGEVPESARAPEPSSAPSSIGRNWRKPHADLLDWHRRLIELRTQKPDRDAGARRE